MQSPTPDDRARILVVDDEPAVLAIVRQLLSDRYDVRFATSGARALALAEAAPPDLILLDVMLPGEDGLSLARGLGGNGPPIIMLSARGEEVTRMVPHAQLLRVTYFRVT